MGRTSPSDQAETIIKLLVTLLAEPHAQAQYLGQALGRSENWVWQMIGEFRQAGIEIDWDKTEKRYRVKFSQALTAKLLGPYAKKLARVLSKAHYSKQPVTFVHALESYTAAEYAQMIGRSVSNVYNMLTGYEKQSLPVGWLGYKTSPTSKWQITKAHVDRRGKPVVPPGVEAIAQIIVMGASGKITPNKSALDGSKCIVVPPYPKGNPVDRPCPNSRFARGFCRDHYYQQRRHPDKFPKPLESIAGSQGPSKSKRAKRCA